MKTEFNMDKAITRAFPNCKHCYGRGYIIRSNPKIRNVLNEINHYYDYCRCVNHVKPEPIDFSKPLKVFELGDSKRHG